MQYQNAYAQQAAVMLSMALSEVRQLIQMRAVARVRPLDALTGRLTIQPVQRHSEAPSTLQGLNQAVTAGVLPIALAGSGDTPLGLCGNTAFRTVHDLMHVALQAGTDTVGEITVHAAVWHYVSHSVALRQARQRYNTKQGYYI